MFAGSEAGDEGPNLAANSRMMLKEEEIENANLRRKKSVKRKRIGVL